MYKLFISFCHSRAGGNPVFQQPSWIPALSCVAAATPAAPPAVPVPAKPDPKVLAAQLKDIRFDFNKKESQTTIIERRSMMRCRKQTWLSLLIAGLLLAGPAFGADPIVYPNKGQSQQQQETDQFQCYNWAKKESGFDPMAAPMATTPPPGAVASRPGRSAAGGALAGLAIGSLSGNAGEGAAIGAAAGGLFGGMRRHKQVQEQDQWANQQASIYEKNRSTYNRAFGACMEGRGYTVK